MSKVRDRQKPAKHHPAMHAAVSPGRDDVHEQREHGQERQGTVEAHPASMPPSAPLRPRVSASKGE